MTIKEMEEKSGMTRANIRFYEAEGLLQPNRLANGYRDYSEEDLAVLKKIKLLRILHFSLEEIKRLHAGEQTLDAALKEHLAKLQLEKESLDQAENICKQMRQDGPQYATLEAQPYIDAIETAMHEAITVPVSDATDDIYVPGRRLGARTLDGLFYLTLWQLIFSLGIGIRIVPGILLSCLMMILLEPVLLSATGTTLGKWILGLKVVDNKGKRLSYKKALKRTLLVFVHGMGLGLPIYNLVRLWKSYGAYASDEDLTWEYDSALVQKDEKKWRVVAYGGVWVILIAAIALSAAMAVMPQNRGDITVAEFSANYNQLAKYYYLTDRLDEHGKWIVEQNVISLDKDSRPVFVFSETDGVMTGLQLSAAQQGSGSMVLGYENEMILAINAFVKAQEQGTLFANETDDVIDYIQDHPFESFEFTVYGVKISCTVTYSGYNYMASYDALVPINGAETSYVYDFSMER